MLAIPSEAILIDHGLDVCFVLRDDSLERRQVKLGKTTRELVEVTQGLEVGEQVVLNPQPDDPDFELEASPHDLPYSEPPPHPASFTGSVAAATIARTDRSEHAAEPKGPGPGFNFPFIKSAAPCRFKIESSNWQCQLSVAGSPAWRRRRSRICKMCRQFARHTNFVH